jgi:urease accessory protein
MDLRLLQLADSAFPSGAFAHSGGLEALRHLGLVPDEAALTRQLTELCWHLARGSLPFLDAAHRGGLAAAAQVDDLQDVFLSNQVANRASRAQGRAFLRAVEAATADPTVGALRRELPFGHLFVATGGALAALGVGLDDARQLALFAAVRSAVSAAVRLGVVGPLAAQAVLLGLHPAVAAALEGTRGLGVGEAAGAAPVLEVAQAAHDSLYSRLFQS